MIALYVLAIIIGSCGALHQMTHAATKPNSLQLRHSSIKMDSNSLSTMREKTEHDLLVRAYKGEEVQRPPVWLMRQVSKLRFSSLTICK